MRTCALLLVLLAFVANGAVAEQGCPNGMYPGGTRPNGPICVPMPGVRGYPPPEPAEPRWAERYGAIATDGGNGLLGTASGMASQRKAEAAALTDCRKSTVNNCAVILTYANQCAVLVVSEDSHLAKAGATVVDARRRAMAECSREGIQCQVVYSECSLPERVE